MGMSDFILVPGKLLDRYTIYQVYNIYRKCQERGAPTINPIKATGSAKGEEHEMFLRLLVKCCFCNLITDLIVPRSLIAHLPSLIGSQKLKPTSDKKIGIMELLYIYK